MSAHTSHELAIAIGNLTGATPKRPPIVVHVCHWCGAMWATYAGSLPRGWARTDKGECCKRCRP